MTSTTIQATTTRAPKSRCESLYYIMNGVFIGSFVLYAAKTQGVFDLSLSSSSSVIAKCPTGIDSRTTTKQAPSNIHGVRGGGRVPQERGVMHDDREDQVDDSRKEITMIPSKPSSSSTVHHHGGGDHDNAEGIDYSFSAEFSSIESCLDPEGPLPVIVMSLGRSGTDSTWQILKELTGTQMKAIEIVGGYKDQSLNFFQSLEGLPSYTDTWTIDEAYDWRQIGGGDESTKGFYFHIKDFCADGNCIDGKWIFKWFCDEQQRYKEVGGLVGFKWKTYLSTLRTEAAYNALQLVAELGVSSTPIRVIRSRRNPFDVYLSELKHSISEDLPDHCDADDEDCMQKHASIRLVVPVDEMFEWLQHTYDEENEIDELLSELGIRTVHVEYDELYYAQTEEDGLKEWNKIFKFLEQRHDWTWDDIAGAAGLKPTTKSRSHKVLIENFDEVFERLKVRLDYGSPPPEIA